MDKSQPLHTSSARLRAMSSFRNHRIVIASLFLPSTAVLGDSFPPTPDNHGKDPSLAIMVPSAFPIVGDIAQGYRPAMQHTRNSGQSTPLKSIVEDLKDKVCWHPVHRNLIIYNYI